MKMMSWSRYHCLSPSLLRAERRARKSRTAKSRLKLRRVWQHSRSVQPLPPVPGAESGLVQYLVRYFQFVIRRFRT